MNHTEDIEPQTINDSGSDNFPKKINNRLILKDLFLIYKEKEIDVVAIQGFNATFNAGEISVIMGPSGSGKTSLLKLIGGVLTPNSGEILFGEAKVSEMDENELAEYRRNSIGFLFQDKNLIPHLTIYENLEFIFDYQNFSHKKTSAQIEFLLKELNLQDRSSHRPTQLSGGQNQRAGLAVALANNPEIILTDEPSGELDSVSRNEIIKLLKTTIEKYPEKILIIVTHDPEFLSIADHVYFLEDGKIKSHMDSVELGEFLKNKTINKVKNGINDTQITIQKSDFEALKEKIKEMQKKIEKIEATKRIY